MDMDSIETVITSAQNVIKSLRGEGKYTKGMAFADLFLQSARLLGLPVANLKRDFIQAPLMTWAIETDNYLMQYRMDKALYDINFEKNRANFMDILFNAYLNDKEAYKIIYDDLIKQGYDVETIQKNMDNRLRDEQGVESVKDLERRWIEPDKEAQYEKTRTKFGKSDMAEDYAYVKASGKFDKTTSDQYYDVLIDAYKNEKSTYYAIYNDMLKSGATEKQIRNAFENRWKKEQNVGSVDDLKTRWFAPDEEKIYNKVSAEVKKSDVWKEASSKYRGKTLERLYTLAVERDTEESDGSEMQAKIDGGKKYGLTESEYMLFLMARDMVDKPSEKSGKLGSYTNDEVEAAIRMLKLSREESSYLWRAAGKNPNSDPWK
jgi:hypothetical protein